MREKIIAETILEQIDVMSPTFLNSINSLDFRIIPENNHEFILKSSYTDINFRIPEKYHLGGVLFTAIYGSPVVITITLNSLDLYDVAVHDILKNKTDITEDVYVDNLIDVLMYNLEKIQSNQILMTKNADA